MTDFKMPQVIKWKPERLHKTVGQMVYMKPCESDICEGNFMEQLWYVTLEKKKPHWYLLQEWDVRKKK